MIRKLKTIILHLSVLSLFLLPVLAVGSVAAQEETPVDSNTIPNAVCQGADLQFKADPGTCSTDADVNGENKVNNLIKQVINIFSIVVGIVAVIMIIYGGFRYITSGGDSGNVTTAKNTILYALVGLLIVVFAQVVVKFILTKITAD